jgi:hypothetical protein
MRFHGVFLGSQHEVWSKQHNGKVSKNRIKSYEKVYTSLDPPGAEVSNLIGGDKP